MRHIEKVFIDGIKKERIKFNEPMSNHTSFKTGGNADIFLTPATKEEIVFCIEKCIEEKIPYTIIGNGSNLLVRDKGIRGAVIQIGNNYGNIMKNDEIITVQSGAMLSKIGNYALENSLEGFEFASGIPGTLGGALTMNAGAYGGEMKDIVETVTAYKDGNVIELKNKDCLFGYRTSLFLKGKYVLLKANIKLKKGIYKEIEKKMKDLMNRRIEKQPLNLPSAGSTFKRPEGYFAGKLIMDSGLKGFSIGGAQVSEKHCGFIVNKGGASSKDIEELIEYVKNNVYSKFNVMLETEVRIIGE